MMDRQLSLLSRPQFPNPTARGIAHYVPVLQTLPGELLALENLPLESWPAMTPLVAVSSRSGATDDPPGRSILPNLPRELAMILGERPFFLDFPWLRSSKLLREELDRVMSTLGADTRGTDLVVDLEYIAPDPGFHAGDLQRFLEQLPGLLEWRSLILLGTVIPESLSQFEENRITPLLRHEWRLWEELRRVNAARVPTFGDYAIQHPKKPRGRGRGMRANIRYSTPGTELIVLGRLLAEHGSEQYRALCAALMEHPEFRSSEYSWGDSQIARCAQGLDDPTSQSGWRGVGISHHLQVAIEAVSKPQ